MSTRRLFGFTIVELLVVAEQARCSKLRLGQKLQL